MRLSQNPVSKFLVFTLFSGFLLLSSPVSAAPIQDLPTEQVQDIQNFLKKEGFFTYPTITGFFGLITHAALKAFQLKHNLPPTGLIDKGTATKIRKESKVHGGKGSGGGTGRDREHNNDEDTPVLEYTLQGVNFDGATSLMRASMNATDSATGLVFFWYRQLWPSGSDGFVNVYNVDLAGTSGNYGGFDRDPAYGLQFGVADSTYDSYIYAFHNGSSQGTIGDWHLFVGAYSIAQNTPHLLKVYTDGVDVTGDLSGNTGGPADVAALAGLSLTIGAIDDGNFSYDLSQLYLGFNQDVLDEDGNIPSEIFDAIRDPITGKPKDIGANGSGVTGTAPTAFYTVKSGETADAFLTDRSGNGNNLTVDSGALTLSETSPGD